MLAFVNIAATLLDIAAVITTTGAPNTLAVSSYTIACTVASPESSINFLVASSVTTLTKVNEVPIALANATAPNASKPKISAPSINQTPAAVELSASPMLTALVAGWITPR